MAAIEGPAITAAVLLLSYWLNWKSIQSRWQKMKEKNVHRQWLLAATLVGLPSTVLAFAWVAINGLDAYGWAGFVIYAIGEVGWAFAIRYDHASRAYEPLALLATSFGLVLWATATVSSKWGWTVPVVVSALYHVVVDLCWYMSFITKSENTLKDTAVEFAAWSGYLAMLHYAFASFITVENLRAENSFTPDIRLTYNRWVRTGDSCADSDCIVFPVYTNYGSIDIGFVVALFSWISGTNHAATYIGLHTNSKYVLQQLGLQDHHHGNTLRTLDWSASASLMMAVNLFLYESPGNITSLISTIAATGLVMLVGWSSEVLHGMGDNWRNGMWGLFAGASVLFATLWIPLIWILAILPHRPENERFERNGPTTSDNMRSPPVEVYFFIAWLIGTFFLFPVVHLFKLRGTSDNSFKYEVWFAILSFVSKLPLLAVFYGGILSRRNTIESDKALNKAAVAFINGTDAAREPDNAAVFMSIGVGVGISVISAAAMLFAFKNTILGSPKAGYSMLFS